MPSYPVYLVALVLCRIAGRLPLAPAVKGNISDDPRVEAEDQGASVSLTCDTISQTGFVTILVPS